MSGVTKTQRFTAEAFLNLPEGVIILSPSFVSEENTYKYRMISTSEESSQDALDKLVVAGMTIALDVQS